MPLPPICLQKAAVRSRCSTACGTGASRVSATGERRSRSFTARGAVTFPCRTPTFPSCCPRTACRTEAAIPSRSAPISSSASARDAAGRRSARPTRWTPSSTRPGITCASHVPTPRGWSMSAWPRGCPSTSTSAASSMRFCISSTRVSGPRSCATSGSSSSTSRSGTSSPRAWC